MKLIDKLVNYLEGGQKYGKSPVPLCVWVTALSAAYVLILFRHTCSG